MNGVQLLLVLIGALAVTAVVAPFAEWVVPGLSLLGALVLGAVVAPPDAVTAVSIGRQLGLPRGLMTVLTGESLVNDAMALTLFTLSVAAITGEHMVFSGTVPLFLYGAIVGAVVGILLGVIVQFARMRLDDPAVGTGLGLVVPFAAYLGAEELGASGVIAVVVAGFSLGHNGARTGYATRIQEREIFEALDLLLEALVFGYMGLQLRFVLRDLREAGIAPGPFIGRAALVLLVTMVVRVVYVAASELRRRLWRSIWGRRWKSQPHPDGERPRRIPVVVPWKYNVVAGWTGMRGVVTIAAASSLPLTLDDGSPFPGRVQIQVVAFVVAVGTLLVQGSTLPALVRLLNISNPQEQVRDDLERERAEQIGREAARSVLTDFIAHPPADLDLGVVRRMMGRFGPPAGPGPGQSESSPTSTGAGPLPGPADPGQPAGWPRPSKAFLAAFGTVRSRMLQAQRDALVAERDSGRLDDEIMREALETLDLEQAAAESRLSAG